MMMMMMMKSFALMTLLLSLWAPVATARLTLLRLAQGDSTYLRGPPKQDSEQEAHLAFRELMSFWGDVSMSVSMSMAPLLPPTVEDLPDFDFFSMSMSFPERPDLPEDAYAWWDLSLSYSMPTDEETGGVVVPNDPTPPVPESTTVEEPESEDSDTTAAKGGINASESSSSGNDAPQMILMVVLVGAVAAVLLALYARRSSRVSSNASVMTPSVSAPLV